MKLTRRLLSLSSFAFISLFSLSGCGARSDTSKLKITNGMDVKETIYPSVVKIKALGGGALSGCTGTFVTPNQVLTAAHCLEGLTPDNAAIFAAKYGADGQEVTSFEADSFQIHPLYDPNAKPNPYDLAVVNFPRHSASKISLIASQRAPLNVWVQLVGYGDNENFYDEKGELTGSGDGQKRIGTNKLLAYDSDMIRIDGVPGKSDKVNPGLQSCSGRGDSGGPLFYNSSTLIGVDYGGGLLKDTAEDGSVTYSCFSLYVDLNLEENVKFLESALNYEMADSDR